MGENNEKIETMEEFNDYIDVDFVDSKDIDNIFGGGKESSNNTSSENAATENDGGDNNNNNNDNNNNTEGEPAKNKDEDGKTAASPESVGGDGKNPDKEGEGEQSNNSDTGSPNVYSIASALRDDELLFTSLNDEEIKGIDSFEKFKEAVLKDRQSMLTETQRRIQDALDNNVKLSEIQKHENVISNCERLIGELSKITDSDIKADSDEAVTLRRNLIYQDLINKGNSKDVARSKVERIFTAGIDRDEAVDAYEACKAFYQKKIEDVKEDMTKLVEKEKNKRQEYSDKLEKSILEEPFFGDLKVDDKTRREILRVATERKRMSNGESLTELERLYAEDPVKFNRNINALLVLTNGFKDISALVKEKAEKEVRKHDSALEKLLRSNGAFNNNPTYAGRQTQESNAPEKKIFFAPDDDIR